MKRLTVLLLLIATLAWPDLSLLNGITTIPTAGTSVPLNTAPVEAAWVTIRALGTNTGRVCLGGSTILAASENGVCLDAGDSYGLGYAPGAPYNLNAISLDATVSGDKVGYTYAR